VSSHLPLRALASAFALLLLGLLFSAGAQASGGTAVGWGSNPAGQVGNGTFTPDTPADHCKCLRTPSPVSGLSGATQLAGGGNFSLALLANGTVMAWGFNEQGELGNGDTSGPERCGTPPVTFPCSTVPIPVPGLANVVAIAAGGEHSLALLANGTVMAWGRNDFGELGNGDTSGPERCGAPPSTRACSTVPIPVPGLANVVAIAAKGSSNLALLANGTAMAWGFDSQGQAGEGTGSQSGCICVDRPIAVPGVSGAMAVSVGSDSGYALLADGTVKAWGANEEGQLGVGAISPDVGCACLGPVSVSGLAGVKALAGGGAHGLATLSNGNVQAWGLGGAGQLGNGNIPTTLCGCSPSPGPVSGLSGPQAISGGGLYSLALLADGSVEAWGENSLGQLGDGTGTQRNLPGAVGGISGASGISAGEVTGFALIGPSQTLKVSPAGTGSGTVGAQGLLCPSSCEARYPQSQVEILRAEPSPGNGFAGFSGPCTGTAPCQVKLDQDQTVTATFGPPKGTAITAAKVSGRGKSGSASFSFTAPGAITGFECELIRPKPARKAHKPKGHRRLKRAAHKQPKPSFSSCGAPMTFKHLKPGHYTFEVRALDILGADSNPALKRFTIKAQKSKRPKGHRR
jgi:alpha-tubulin suppressor-like RCC1 family protein